MNEALARRGIDSSTDDVILHVGCRKKGFCMMAESTIVHQALVSATFPLEPSLHSTKFPSPLNSFRFYHNYFESKALFTPPNYNMSTTNTSKKVPYMLGRDYYASARYLCHEYSAPNSQAVLMRSFAPQTCNVTPSDSRPTWLLASSIYQAAERRR